MPQDALFGIASRYSRRIRREHRRNKIVRISKWVGVIFAGFAFGAVLIGLASYLADIPLRGW